MKHWKPAPADEDWKVAICQRDIAQVDDVLGYLVYILTNVGNDRAAGLNELRGMTGETIVEGLKSYRRTRLRSLETGFDEQVCGTPEYDILRKAWQQRGFTLLFAAIDCGTQLCMSIHRMDGLETSPSGFRNHAERLKRPDVPPYSLPTEAELHELNGALQDWARQHGYLKEAA